MGAGTSAADHVSCTTLSNDRSPKRYSLMSEIGGKRTYDIANLPQTSFLGGNEERRFRATANLIECRKSFRPIGFTS